MYKRQVKRNYEEFVERLGGERSNNNNEYLPYSETEIAVDDVKDDNITYLILTEYNKGDRTILEHDQVHDRIIWNNHINLNDIVEEYDNIDNHYIDNHEIMYVIVNEWYNHKIRLLFDDKG